MDYYILNSLIVSLLLITSNAANVESINKCSIKDRKCLQAYYEGIYKTWTTSGFPELGVVSIDPLNVLEKDTLSLNNQLNIVVKRGVVTGLKNCTILGYSIDFDKEIMSYDTICDSLKIDVDLSFEGSNALIQSSIGVKQLDGSQGHAIITAEKVGAKYQIRYKLIKGDDGKTYFTFPDNKNEHTYEVGSVKVDIGKLIIGGQNLGPLLTEVINKNTKPFLATFGSPIIDKILEYMILSFEKLFRQIPTQNFISDDLSSYV